MVAVDVEADLEAQRAQFGQIPWCAALLDDPGAHVTLPASRRARVDGLYTYLGQTLNTPDTVPAMVLVYDKAAAPRQWVHVLKGIVRLGGGVNGHVDICHGGITTTLLDEMMGLLVTLNMRRQAIPGPAYMTAYLNTNFLRPVKAHGTYLVVATVTKLEGRKLYISATFEDGDARLLLVKSDAMFVRMKEKM